MSETRKPERARGEAAAEPEALVRPVAQLAQLRRAPRRTGPFQERQHHVDLFGRRPFNEPLEHLAEHRLGHFRVSEGSARWRSLPFRLE